jgi:hypothetical protein
MSAKRAVPLSELTAGMTVQLPPGGPMDRTTVRIITIDPLRDDERRAADIEIVYGGRAKQRRSIVLHEIPDGYIVRTEADQQVGGAA